MGYHTTLEWREDLSKLSFQPGFFTITTFPGEDLGKKLSQQDKFTPSLKSETADSQL